MRRTNLVTAGVLALASCGGGGKRGPGGAVWLGVIGTGQSLSVGAASNGLVFTTPSASSVKLSLGARAMDCPIRATDPGLSLPPLAEPIRPINTTTFSAPYPINIYGETFHTAMAMQLDAINQAGG